MGVELALGDGVATGEAPRAFEKAAIPGGYAVMVTRAMPSRSGTASVHTTGGATVARSLQAGMERAYV